MIKSKNRIERKILASLFLLLIPFLGSAQKGYSSASFSMSKMRAQQGVIPSPEEVKVEEHVNYHEHQLPAPEKGEAVNMELRWGNEQIGHGNRNAILQVGLTTEQLEDLSSIPPVNVSLVIDKSGSMNGPRIQKARDAALTFVDRLRPRDRISIVTFNQQVQTVLPSTSASKKGRIKQAIRNIRAGGSTNLNDGLIQGYKQVASHYQEEGNSKVIMLTDALTNTGTVDPRKIVKNSRVYNKGQDIGISMIGVGVNFNNGLSRKLTDDARTSIHFINDAADIKKVFIDEVESLLSPRARDVELELSFGDGLELERVYGHEVERRGKQLRIDLKQMNSGLTQVVLAKFRLHHPGKVHHGPEMGEPGMKGGMRECSGWRSLVEEDPELEAKLHFYDVQKKKRVTLSGSKRLHAERDPEKRPDKLADPVVKKNYSIAYLAQGLKEMAKVNQKGDRSRAEKIAEQRLKAVQREYPSWKKDPDIERVAALLEKYVPATKKQYTSTY